MLQLAVSANMKTPTAEKKKAFLIPYSSVQQKQP